MEDSTAPKIRTNLYFNRQIHAEFKKTCKREGVKMSIKLEKYMAQYNQAHRNGNPQLTMVVYAKPESPQPMRVLCARLDGALSDGRVHCQRAGMWVPGVRCYSCEDNRLRKK